MKPTPQPHPQPRTLDELLANAEHYANYCVGNSGRVTPALFFLGPDGQGMFVLQSLAGEAEKDSFADMARLARLAHAATAAVMVLEAWAKFPMPGEDFDATEAPSEAIDRKEYVILMGGIAGRQPAEVAADHPQPKRQVFRLWRSPRPGADEMKGRFLEQTAIAEVLTEMDLELAALEQRREKTRALKQAMMQELLTGRTRLVVNEGVK